MPVFLCKALTPQGQIVKIKVEESSRLTCTRKLKRNGFTPINISQSLSSKTTNQKRRNIKRGTTSVSTLKSAKNKKKKKYGGIWEKLNTDVGGGKRITSKDVRVFTQNFYLLKKANFNNIHALTTVIQSTENPRLVNVLEDILAGVEAGDYMYTTMEYYSNIFPYIYINMIKVGELSRFA